MSDEVVTYELDGAIALIGLNRPHKRNALTEAVFTGLFEAVMRAWDEAKVGIVFGHGEHFSAGLDLAQFAERMGDRTRRRRRYRFRNAYEAMERGEIPFLSALRGAVVGGGLELAAATHIRVADETTFFGLPEGRRGIFVGGGGSVRVSRLMSVARMTDLMLTGRVLDAREGERLNLCQYVVPSGQSLAKCKELALRITENSPHSNYAITNGLPRLRELPHEEGLFFEGLVAGSTMGPEALERIKAFIEKRAEPLAVPGRQQEE
ncbi:MAG: crotonase/enoyl-CoA hydratase family protein [Acetobacteraceae bacterium]